MAKDEKPSFYKSVASGIGGWIRGALTGGVAGGLAGAVIGGIVALATGDIAALGMGAAIGGGTLASIGATAGIITGVVKSREAGQPSAEDVVNVAKITFAQGVATGQAMVMEEAQQQMQAATKFQDRLAAERAAKAQGIGQNQRG